MLMKPRYWICLITVAVVCLVVDLAILVTRPGRPIDAAKGASPMTHTSEDQGDTVHKSEAEWKEILTTQQFYVTRQKGTERAFTGEYFKTKTKGTYHCVCCGETLFSSDAKFDSGTGWPSFWEPIAEQNVKTEDDDSYFSHRTEVMCRRCGVHLGHVFPDGPQPTGLRYCINSASLRLEPKQEKDSVGGDDR